MEIILNQPYSFLQLGRRGNQEDARFPDMDAPQDCRPVFIVCDGVGGEAAGEVASSTVAQALGEYMQHIDLAHKFTHADFAKALDYAYSWLERRSREGSRRMATTLTFLCFDNSGAFCAHIGDSRIYHIRPGVGIMYQSEDHSLVNALVHSGNLTPEEAINHPQSNVITRCMCLPENGAKRSAADTILIRDIEPGDYFFLCSDGVLHSVEDSILYAILSSDRSDSEKIREIAARSKTSSDNNTAWLVGIADVIYEGNEKREAAEVVEESEAAVEEYDSTPEEMEEIPTGLTTSPLDELPEMVEEISPSPSSKSLLSILKNLFK